MPAYDAERWSEFAVGQLGASAALLGLVFVSLSINLRDIVKSGLLVNRAGETALAVEAGGGLYWWPAGVTAAYVSALTNAWVLLIEILR
ncbi:MAG: hypothetical protein ACRDIL_15965 [Candidatus Limnocylindrales bacterium]